MTKWILALTQFPVARKRHLTLATWIWILIWVVILASYHPLIQTLISQAHPKRLQNVKIHLKENLLWVIVRGKRTAFHSLLNLMSWIILILVQL
uniref:Uncharacterized protein n=1 Tax=Salix viminalis TaxID=40686 RepID=A0A6N2KEG3_SALVM